MKLPVLIDIPDGINAEHYVADAIKSGVNWHIPLPYDHDLREAAELAQETLRGLTTGNRIIRGVIPQQDAELALNALTRALERS